ncbi:hypothetical protein JCGZ_06415 [Jatropha curcas]|uniref:RING-type domain-containing protein n=1 Tax=Jatropha curcas TaxID=180498 RepID=A0A067JLF2_JATCU|nr:uncharacterized protein LOC105650374 [Jatropha curcas]KDP20329.1 hypothetical protein JCGZ_06415 [Jatropha curcas]
MEEMDIEQVVDVPDTPDRIIAHAQLGRESNSSAAAHSRTSDFRDKECLNKLGVSSRLVGESGHDRRLRLNRQGVPVNMDELKPRNKSIAFSPSENFYPSKNIPLFRRGAMVNDSKPETHNIGMRSRDKGKAEHIKMPSKQPLYLEKDALFDMAFPRSASKSLQAQETRDVQISSNGESSLHFSRMTSSNSLKGKEKIGVSSCNGSGSAINHGKEVDLNSVSQPKVEKQMSASHLAVTSPRVTGQKRLVRNGCISPHNIASRAQRLAERLRVGSADIGKYHSSNMVSDGPPTVDIKEVVAEENNCHRAKGKGLVLHSSKSKEHDAKVANVSTSSGPNNKAPNESRDALLGGWRSTRNRGKKMYYPDDEDGCFGDEQLERRDNGNGNFTSNGGDSTDQGEGQTASRHVSGHNQTSQPHHIGNGHTKRQKKRALTLRNHSECSSIVPDDSEIFFLGSSLESSSSRSSRTLNRQHQGILDPIYEIDDESFTEMRNGNSQGLGSVNDDSDARARQVEADEMLARELQEQLYHEVPVFGGSEPDEDLAWVLQQEEDTFLAASSQNHPRSRTRSSSTLHANRQPQPRSFHNPSNRRVAQARVPATRTSQLRSRLFNRSPAALSRARNPSLATLSTARNFQFPLGMDIDMRLDILEALEEFSDMSMTTSRILQVQRDFNENDYEMLLALDENNHQRGASVNRINSLPESTVQTDNFEETCAICLETPTVGETIRHLPCLHKFHKDCIDPWLGRKTSCPVCKSSIT